MPAKRTGWNDARRRKQAENIRKTRPWEKTTGPKSAEGKAAVSQNALKTGMHTGDMRELRRLLAAHRRFLDAVKARQAAILRDILRP